MKIEKTLIKFVPSASFLNRPLGGSYSTYACNLVGWNADIMEEPNIFFHSWTYNGGGHSLECIKNIEDLL
jgi:hypothetical protein